MKRNESWSGRLHTTIEGNILVKCLESYVVVAIIVKVSFLGCARQKSKKGGSMISCFSVCN